MPQNQETARRSLPWAALAAALLLWGCAAAPPVPPVAPLPPPRPPLTSQERALDRALRQFYGAPYRSGGTTPEGVDCSGLVLGVYQRVGVALPRTAADQFTTGQSIPLGRLRFGDVVFFNRFCQVKKSDPYRAELLPPAFLLEVCHNGIYLGDGRFLHASSRGVQVSHLGAEVWRNSYIGARRYLFPGGAESP